MAWKHVNTRCYLNMALYLCLNSVLYNVNLNAKHDMIIAQEVTLAHDNISPDMEVPFIHNIKLRVRYTACPLFGLYCIKYRVYHLTFYISKLNKQSIPKIIQWISNKKKTACLHISLVVSSEISIFGHLWWTVLQLRVVWLAMAPVRSIFYISHHQAAIVYGNLTWHTCQYKHTGVKCISP
jgi:hypothetical protein